MLSVCRRIIPPFGDRTSRFRKGFLYMSLGKLFSLSKTIHSTSKSNPTCSHPHRIKSIQGKPPLSKLNQFNLASAMYAGNVLPRRRYWCNIPDYTPIRDRTNVLSAGKSLLPPLLYSFIPACTPAKNRWNVKSAENGSERVVIYENMNVSTRENENFNVRWMVVGNAF